MEAKPKLVRAGYCAESRITSNTEAVLRIASTDKFMHVVDYVGVAHLKKPK